MQHGFDLLHAQQASSSLVSYRVKQKVLTRSMLQSHPFSMGAFRGHENAVTFSGHNTNMGDALGAVGRALVENGKNMCIAINLACIIELSGLFKP